MPRISRGVDVANARVHSDGSRSRSEASYVLKLLYLLVTTTAMCLELIAVMNTTLLSMMGPGLALRGPDGSMHPAVDGMMEEYNERERKSLNSS